MIYDARMLFIKSFGVLESETPKKNLQFLSKKFNVSLKFYLSIFFAQKVYFLDIILFISASRVE